MAVATASALVEAPARPVEAAVVATVRGWGPPIWAADQLPESPEPLPGPHIEAHALAIAFGSRPM
jgi:hypothetical protein